MCAQPCLLLRYERTRIANVITLGTTGSRKARGHRDLCLFTNSSGSGIEKHFKGKWKFLHKIIYELPHEEATKALVELALYFRALDDEQDLTGFWKQVGVSVVGSLVLKNGDIQSLSPREMSNKIIHAEEIKWDFSEEQPRIICTGRNKEEWLRAIIDVWKMLWIGAQLGS